MEKKEDIKLAVVRQFRTEVEANIVKALLEANGIQCSLVHSTVAGVLPLQSSDFDIQLVARQEDLPKINALFKAKFDKSEMG